MLKAYLSMPPDKAVISPPGAAELYAGNGFSAGKNRIIYWLQKDLEAGILRGLNDGDRMVGRSVSV